MTAFWFQKNLMPRLVGKFYNFVLYRGAIPRSNSINDPCVEWRLMEIGTNDLVRLLCSVSNPTRDLFHMEHSIGIVIKCVEIMFLSRNTL